MLQRLRALSRRPAVRGVVAGVILLLSFGYMGYILASNWEELTAYRWRFQAGPIALAFGSYSLALFLATLSWGLMVQRLTGVGGLGRHFRYYVYITLLRRLPAPFLDFIGRAYLYDQEGVAGPVMAALTLFEWILIIVSGIPVYLLTSPFLPLPPVWKSPWVGLGGLGLGLLLVHPRIIRALLRLVTKGSLSFTFGYRDLAGWLALYSLAWIMGGVTLYAVTTSLYALPLSDLPGVVGIWALSGMVILFVLLTPSGFGIKELALGMLLGYLIPPSLAVVVALLMRVVLTLFEMVWGVIVLRLGPRRTRHISRLEEHQGS